MRRGWKQNQLQDIAQVKFVSNFLIVFGKTLKEQTEKLEGLYWKKGKIDFSAL